MGTVWRRGSGEGGGRSSVVHADSGVVQCTQSMEVCLCRI